MTQYQAVVNALDILGDRTSLAELCKVASREYGGRISASAASKARAKWRLENNVENHDCRTYEGQPRRNMLNDAKVELPQVRRIRKFVDQGGNLSVLATLINEGGGCFHSVDQLRFAVKEFIELQVPVQRRKSA